MGGPGFTINRIINQSKPLELYEIDGSGYMVYSGGNDNVNADPSDLNWTITRYWYNENGQVTKSQRLSGSWNDKEELPWREAVSVRKTDFVRHTITADDVVNGYFEEAWSKTTIDKIVELLGVLYDTSGAVVYGIGGGQGLWFSMTSSTITVGPEGSWEEGDVATISIHYEQAV